MEVGGSFRPCSPSAVSMNRLACRLAPWVERNLRLHREKFFSISRHCFSSTMSRNSFMSSDCIASSAFPSVGPRRRAAVRRRRERGVSSGKHHRVSHTTKLLGREPRHFSHRSQDAGREENALPICFNCFSDSGPSTSTLSAPALKYCLARWMAASIPSGAARRCGLGWKWAPSLPRRHRHLHLGDHLFDGNDFLVVHVLALLRDRLVFDAQPVNPARRVSALMWVTPMSLAVATAAAAAAYPSTICRNCSIRYR
jgi:hypothetical protein